MIDPDNIIIPIPNQVTTLTMDEVPEFDFATYDLNSDKDLKKYLRYIEGEVRHSFEYREFIAYIKDFYGMNQSGFEQVDTTNNKAIKIEIHHYPYSLFDIVSIIYHKRCYYNESLEPQMLAKEVMMLHYKLLVGLVPLTTTEHQLMHDGKLFYPANKILGRWDVFEKLYQSWIGSDLLDMTERIRQYSDDNSDLMKTMEILQPKHIVYQFNKESGYRLPEPANIQNNLNNRLKEIKKNNYKLPVQEDIEKTDTVKTDKPIQPIFFYNS